jgi:hypothetical protein
MPYSENQKTLFCIAAAIKRGDQKPSYSAQAAKMAEEMSQEELDKHCKMAVKK